VPLLLYYSPPPISLWYEPWDYTQQIRGEIETEKRRAEEDALLLLWWVLNGGGLE
jgi:hypothetical protein